MSREVCGICWCPYDENTGECACEPEPKKQHMTTLRTAAQQALEAWDQPHGINYVDFRPYMDALRAALAEPVQEPVAWVHPTQGHMQRRTETMSPEVVASYGRGGWTPLYAAPPQRKPLTEKEIDSIWDSEKAFADIYAIVRAIERAHGIT